MRFSISAVSFLSLACAAIAMPMQERAKHSSCACTDAGSSQPKLTLPQPRTLPSATTPVDQSSLHLAREPPVTPSLALNLSHTDRRAATTSHWWGPGPVSLQTTTSSSSRFWGVGPVSLHGKWAFLRLRLCSDIFFSLDLVVCHADRLIQSYLARTLSALDIILGLSHALYHKVMHI
jgi:hypothetical protein